MKERLCEVEGDGGKSSKVPRKDSGESGRKREHAQLRAGGTYDMNSRQADIFADWVR